MTDNRQFVHVTDILVISALPIAQIIQLLRFFWSVTSSDSITVLTYIGAHLLSHATSVPSMIGWPWVHLTVGRLCPWLISLASLVMHVFDHAPTMRTPSALWSWLGDGLPPVDSLESDDLFVNHSQVLWANALLYRTCFLFHRQLLKRGILADKDSKTRLTWTDAHIIVSTPFSPMVNDLSDCPLPTPWKERLPWHTFRPAPRLCCVPGHYGCVRANWIRIRSDFCALQWPRIDRTALFIEPRTGRLYGDLWLCE